jgi:hypothetical protein
VRLAAATGKGGVTDPGTELDTAVARMVEQLWQGVLAVERAVELEPLEAIAASRSNGSYVRENTSRSPSAWSLLRSTS